MRDRPRTVLAVVSSGFSGHEDFSLLSSTGDWVNLSASSELGSLLSKSL